MSLQFWSLKVQTSLARLRLAVTTWQLAMVRVCVRERAVTWPNEKPTKHPFQWHAPITLKPTPRPYVLRAADHL